MSFARRLKSLRENRKPKIYQKELADILGVSRQAITMWEIGQRMPETAILEKIADFFNVSVDYLLGRVDKPGPLGSGPDFETYEYQAKTLADALIELSELHFKYQFDDDLMTRLVRKAIAKYGAPKPVLTEKAAHGPNHPGSGAFDFDFDDDDE